MASFTFQRIIHRLPFGKRDEEALCGINWIIGEKEPLKFSDDDDDEGHPYTPQDIAEYLVPVGHESIIIDNVYSFEEPIPDKFVSLESLRTMLKISCIPGKQLTWWDVMQAIIQWHNQVENPRDFSGDHSYFEGVTRSGTLDGIPTYSIFWGS